MKTNSSDITKEGISPLQGIRGEDLYEPSSKDKALAAYQSSARRAANAYRGNLGYEHLSDPKLITPEETNLTLGQSVYDQTFMRAPTEEKISNTRADSQPWYLQLGAGIAKGVSLAATTFLDGTVGLAVGMIDAINRGEWAGLWDNPFSRAMKDWNDMMEDQLTNYYSTEELNNPWYKNILSANWLGDKFIKNLGFTVGAYYSGKVFAAPLKLVGAGGKVGAGVHGLSSAVNEGRIEALNNSTDWYNLHKAQLDDQYQQRLDAAFDELEATKGNLIGDKEHGYRDPAYDKYNEIVNKIKNDYNATLSRLERDRKRMGNADLAMNIPILTASNIIQFGKLMGRGFKTNKRISGELKGSKLPKSKAEGALRKSKPIGVKGSAKTGYTAEISSLAAKTGGIRGALSEGAEEMEQSVASTTAGNYYATDVNNFYKSRIDPEAEQETLSWVKSFGSAIAETVGNEDSWEEFFIGALTGALGMPHFSKKGIKLENNIFSNWREAHKERAEQMAMADKMNEIIQSPDRLNKYQSTIRRTKYQNMADEALENNDQFSYENATHAQLVSDIALFKRAGKEADLIDLIENSLDISDENLQAIIENTTTETADGKKVGPWIDTNGNPITNTQEGKQKMIDTLKQNKEDYISLVKEYSTSLDNLESYTKGRLNEDQLEELAWMDTQINNWVKRSESMSGEIKDVIGRITNQYRENIEVLTSVRDREGASHVEKTPLYDKYDSSLRVNQQNYDDLNNLASMSPKAFTSVLTSKDNAKVVDQLIKEIEGLDDPSFSKPEREEAVTKLKDLQKIGEAIETYSNKFDEYLADPQKQLEDQQKAIEDVAKATVEKEKGNIRDRLVQAKSIREFSDILGKEENQELANSVARTLREEGNEVAKNHYEVTQYDNELRNALQSSSASTEAQQDALQLWNKQMERAEDLEQVSNMNSLAITDEKAFTNTIEDQGTASTRFQNAKYALQQAMSEVNKSIKFKNRFAPEAKQPEKAPKGKGTPKDTTGDSGTATVPHANPISSEKESKGSDKGDSTVDKDNYTAPTGDISTEDVADENKELNNRSVAPSEFDKQNKGQKRYYRPAIPEIQIDAAREGDFRPFDVVVKEKQGKDFSKIYDYLQKEGAFNYVNSGKLKAGEPLFFMIDPEFEATVENEKWHTAPTVFITTKDGQVVGSLDEGASTANFVGLDNLLEKVRDEYQVSRSGTDTKKVVSTNTVTGSNGRVRTSEVHEVSRTTDREGTVVVELKEVITSDSEKQSLVGREVTSGGLEISLDSNVIDWKRQAAGGRREDGTTVTPEQVTSEEEQDAKEQMETLLENISGQIQPFYASTIYYAKDGRIIAKDKKGNTLYLKSDPLNTSSVDSQTITRFFATPQTKVSQIMIGKVPYTSEDRSLNSIPGAKDNPIFGIIKSGSLDTNGKLEDSLVIKPANMADKEGRLYLLIPNAAGTYSPVAVRVKHFNAQEFNPNDATVASTSACTSIIKAIERLATSDSEKDVTNAVKELSEYLYLGKGSPAERDINISWFDAAAGSGIVISKKLKNPDGSYVTYEENGTTHIKEDPISIYFQTNRKRIQHEGISIDIEVAKSAGMDISSAGQPRSTEDIKNDIINALLKFNPPLQVRLSNINKSTYNTDIIESNVLTSNIREAKVISNWFTMDYFDNQGNLQKAVNPPSAKSAPTRRRTPSPVGGKEGTVEGTAVTFNGASYIVNLKAGTYKDGSGRTFDRVTGSPNVFDIAWAQETYGNATEGLNMTENKVITPDGRVLNRNTGAYLPETLAKQIKDKIAGRTQSVEAKVKQSKKILANVVKTPVSAQSSTAKSEIKKDNQLPIFDSSLEVMNPVNRVIPENAFDDGGGQIGYYDLDGTLYTGYIKKIGEVEVTLASGEKVNYPIHVTKNKNKVTDISGNDAGYGNTSEYYAIFQNGKAMYSGDYTSDEGMFEAIINEMKAHPQEVAKASNETTKVYNPSSASKASTETGNNGAQEMVAKESAANKGNIRRRRHKLRATDSRREVWNEQKELEWLDKVLPQLSREDRVKVVNGLIQVAENGPVAWGMFSDGIVTLSDIAAEGTAYHEAFHVVFNLLLNQEERANLFNEARQLYGNKSLEDLEEDMAEGFREYIMSKDSRGLGRKILDFFRNLFAKVTNWKYIKPSLYSYYRMIDQGAYSKSKLSDSSSTRLREEEYTDEMNSIKEAAIADGSFMKAPNGNPTNLNERQWLQVRTKNFINWFGDWINNPSEASKVVDENGEPLVVYHGSKYKFNKFTLDKYATEHDPGVYGKGHYFTANKNTAEAYGEHNELYEVFLNIRNPFNGSEDIVSNLGEITSSEEFKKEYKDVLEEQNMSDDEVNNLLGNYDTTDGVIVNGANETFYEIVVFNPNQIKSATSNTGEFSTTNDDIRYRRVDINSLESLIDYEYNKAKNIVRTLNNKRFNTKDEALEAFNNSGVNKDFLYRITRKNANNAVGYKIQILTKDAFERYKDSILTEQEYNNEKEEEGRYFDSLDPDIQTELLNKGWTKEIFDSISQQERDNAINCISF